MQKNTDLFKRKNIHIEGKINFPIKKLKSQKRKRK